MRFVGYACPAESASTCRGSPGLVAGLAGLVAGKPKPIFEPVFEPCITEGSSCRSHLYANLAADKMLLPANLWVTNARSR
jgi:hypothetical protein